MTVQSTSSRLPPPDAAAKNHSDTLLKQIERTIHAQGGWISFAEYMHLALYTPHLGYYSGDSNKFGSGGDFVTAPELSPLFARALCNQLLPVLAETGGNILELGAGTGKLAQGVLQSLHALGQLPERYMILEVSASLRERQQKTLRASLEADVYQRLHWLDCLPEQFTGVVLGNEVLDAIPSHVLTWENGHWLEQGVAYASGLVWQTRPLANVGLAAGIDASALPEGYTTEVNPAAQGLIASLADSLQHGLIWLADYGFSAREYYHPQRRQGTLMCHYQHYAHDNPLIHPGLQDITAHVDFTAIAETALKHGLDCAGYSSQAQFLVNCGILQLLQQENPADSARYLPMVAAVQKLLSPAEMGELFKVLALSKGLSLPLSGFVQGDKRHTL